MAELKNLRYVNSMKEYQNKFEQLLTQVNITELQSVSMFIGGLPTSIEMNVRMFRPQTLSDAFSLANFQEASLAVVKQKAAPLLPTPRNPPNHFFNRNVNFAPKPNNIALPAPTTQTITKHPASDNSVPRKLLTQKEIAEKRAKNQCFYCDQRYTPGHKCSGQMFALEVSPYKEEDADLSLEDAIHEADALESDEPAFFMSECHPQISLNALSGIPTFNTMRMKATVSKHVLHLLVDSGITHNFFGLVHC